MIVLSALFAVGVGLAAMPGASAAPAGYGIGNAAENATLLDQVQYRRCRAVRVCHRGPFGGRRCHVERVCRW
jgi:hypothetical protein